jgi:nitrite reductase/ring-hydroxylating ferredoxin subunit
MGDRILGGRFPFGLPSGWFVVATSGEVRPGAVLARRYFERELALFRTRSGRLAVIDAYCPHMGAHLGRVGSVEGEALRCGFHGFAFDASGKCVATATDGPPPPAARLSRWKVREQNGLILVWFDPLGREPEWEVPALPDTGWTRILWRRFRIATHPQETTENSVDFGHFTQLHGFVDGEIVDPVRTDGPYLESTYRAWRPYGLPGRKPFYKVPVEYHVRVWGLGYSQVNVAVGLLGIDARVWVLPVPVDGEHIDLVLGVAAPKKLRAITPILRRILCKEVGQDLDVWNYKAYLPHPQLAKGDGPIGTYRRWARQFYPPEQS